jgi:FAD:protein FMN transferase
LTFKTSNFELVSCFEIRISDLRIEILNLRFSPVLLVIAIAAAQSRADDAPTLHRYTFTENHMAVPWKIVLYAADETDANHAAQAAYARIEQLNHILSDYDSDSELSRLSATSPSPKPLPVSDDLWCVLDFARGLSEQSDGAFDITVGPLTKLWRRARRTGEMPRADLLATARQATDYRALKLDPATHTAQLMKPNMRLDAGGIGMGYAVDEAFKVLKHEGITSALIDASGDIGLSDPPPHEPGWRIGIEPPSGEGPPSRYVLLSNYAITTSGDAFQAVEIDGQRYSHIIDPRTGLGVTGHSSVTIIAPDCITADSYTKPICVLGPEAGFKIIEATPGAAAFVEREVASPDGNRTVDVQESKRFHQFLTTPE